VKGDNMIVEMACFYNGIAIFFKIFNYKNKCGHYGIW